MTNIMVFDSDEDRLITIAEDNDMTIAELIDYLLDMVEDGSVEI